MSKSTPFSMDLTFTQHDQAVIEKSSSALVDRDLPAGTGGMVGGEGYAWIQVREPFECVEITPSSPIRREVAHDLRADAAFEMAEIWDQNDAALWASATRIRSHARGGTPLSELEADELIRGLLGHMICEHLGGRPARTNSRPMDRKRLNRRIRRCSPYGTANSVQARRCGRNESLPVHPDLQDGHRSGATRLRNGQEDGKGQNADAY